MSLVQDFDFVSPFVPFRVDDNGVGIFLGDLVQDVCGYREIVGRGAGCQVLQAFQQLPVFRIIQVGFLFALLDFDDVNRCGVRSFDFGDVVFFPVAVYTLPDMALNGGGEHFVCEFAFGQHPVAFAVKPGFAFRGPVIKFGDVETLLVFPFRVSCPRVFGFECVDDLLVGDSVLCVAGIARYAENQHQGE